MLANTFEKAVGTRIIKFQSQYNIYIKSFLHISKNCWNCFRLALVVVIHRKDPIDIAEDIRESTGL